MYSFSYLEPVCCSMSSSNCCFLTCIQVSQEAGQMVWYSHLLKNFPQFIVIHTVEVFGIVKKGEVDAFLEFSCFFYDPTDVGSLIYLQVASCISSSACSGEQSRCYLPLSAVLETVTWWLPCQRLFMMPLSPGLLTELCLVLKRGAQSSHRILS